MMRMGMRVERRAAETVVTRCLVSRVNVSCPCVRYLMKLCVGLNADSERDGLETVRYGLAGNDER